MEDEMIRMIKSQRNDPFFYSLKKALGMDKFGSESGAYQYNPTNQRKVMNTIYVHPVRSIVKACHGNIPAQCAALESLSMFGYRLKYGQLNAKHLGGLPKRVLDATAQAAENANHRKFIKRGA